MENQKDQKKQELRDLIEEDRQHIIAFFKTFNLKVKSQIYFALIESKIFSNS